MQQNVNHGSTTAMTVDQVQSSIFASAQPAPAVLARPGSTTSSPKVQVSQAVTAAPNGVITIVTT